MILLGRNKHIFSFFSFFTVIKCHTNALFWNKIWIRKRKRTPCSLAARVIFNRRSSSTNGRTASWMMTTLGLGVRESAELLKAWSPLKIDLCLEVPPWTTLTFVWFNFWTIFSIKSWFSLATTTTTVPIHDNLTRNHRKTAFICQVWNTIQRNNIIAVTESVNKLYVMLL